MSSLFVKRENTQDAHTSGQHATALCIVDPNWLLTLNASQYDHKLTFQASYINICFFSLFSVIIISLLLILESWYFWF